MPLPALQVTRTDVLVDIAGLVVVFLVVTAAKAMIVVGALKIDPRHVPLEDPRGYAVEYLTPLLMLPALTLLLRRHDVGWVELGLRSPEAWIGFAVWVAVVTALALILNAGIRRLPALWGAEWPASPFEALAGDKTALLLVGVYAALLVGLTEEMVFRGFLMSRLAELFGMTIGAWWGAAILTGLVFGLLHVGQGTMGAVNATALGILFGAAYLVCGHNLWVVVVAHSLYDTVRVLQYFTG